MRNLMQRGETWLSSQLKIAAGRQVSYSRGNLESSPLTAVLLLNEYVVVGADQFTPIQVQYMDWVLIGEELALPGIGRIWPQQGDRICLTAAGGFAKYEVQPIGKRPCFEPNGSGGTSIIIHTLELRNE